MRRRHILAKSSTQGFCVFCACRLGLDLSFASIAPNIRRRLTTCQSLKQPASEASAATVIHDAPIEHSPEQRATDPSSTLTLSEVRAKAERLRLQEEAVARKQKLDGLPTWRASTAGSGAKRVAGQRQGDWQQGNNIQPTPVAFRESVGTSKSATDIRSQSGFINGGRRNDSPFHRNRAQAPSSSDLPSESNKGVFANQNQMADHKSGRGKRKTQVNSEARRIVPPVPRVKNPFESSPTETTKAAPSPSPGWGIGVTDTKPLTYDDSPEPEASKLVRSPAIGESPSQIVAPDVSSRPTEKSDVPSPNRDFPKTSNLSGNYGDEFRQRDHSTRPEHEVTLRHSHVESYEPSHKDQDPSPKSQVSISNSSSRKLLVAASATPEQPAQTQMAAQTSTGNEGAAYSVQQDLQQSSERETRLQNALPRSSGNIRGESNTQSIKTPSGPPKNGAFGLGSIRDFVLSTDSTPQSQSQTNFTVQKISIPRKSEQKPSLESLQSEHDGQNPADDSARGPTQLRENGSTLEILQNSNPFHRSPLGSKDSFVDSSSSPENMPASWQHLRRKPSPVPSAAPQSEQQALKLRAQDFSFDHVAVDHQFHDHVRQRSSTFSFRPFENISKNSSSRTAYGSERPTTERTCARCGQKGHIARQCMMITCYKCGEKGHPASDCQSAHVESQGTSSSSKNMRSPSDLSSQDVPGVPPAVREKQPGSLYTPFADAANNSHGDTDPGRRFVDPLAGWTASSTEQPWTRGRNTDRFASRDEKEANPYPGENRQMQHNVSQSMRWRSNATDIEAHKLSFEEVGKREARVARRSSQWDDEDDEVQEHVRTTDRRKERRGGKKKINDEEDEEQDARAAYRAKKATRQSQRDAERTARKRDREARKAEQSTPITLPEFVSVQQLSQLLGVRYEPFVEHLEELGYNDIFASKALNFETSSMIAMEYNFEPNFDSAAREGQERDLKPGPVVDIQTLPSRPPVVTIMGHVDHGKTTILDYLRHSSVAAGEAGGITQHIGAFSVPLASSGKTITFLDTPGHAAFLAMRQRGANVTDIVVLVVAADDSVKPQTLEALKHAKAANVPIIVAINKVDKPEADIERCKQDLARHSVDIEDFGGETPVVSISGKTGQGMDQLEENIVTLAEILDHRADTDGDVEGWVLEATTKKAGRVATILVRRGTLRPGVVLVAGKTWARVKTLKNEAGQMIDEVGPGMPVEVSGWKDQPIAGDEVLQAPHEQKACSVVEYRLEVEERGKTAQDMEVINENRRLEHDKREREKTAERISKREHAAAVAAGGESSELAASAVSASGSIDEQPRKSGQIIVPFIIKADVSGSVEAVSAYMLSASNPLIAPQILHASVGAIRESDIELASVAGGCIIAFNLPPDAEKQGLAEAEGVPVLTHNIIYRVLDDVKGVLEARLPPLITRRVLGEADISAAFDIGVGGRKKIRIAGCKVRNGAVARGTRVRVIRAGETVYDGLITSLKNVKKDVQEMRKGTECGMGFEEWESFEVGDTLQAYEEVEERRKLYT